MKKDWEIKKLGDIVNTINGLWTGKKEPYISVKAYTMSNFTKDCEINYLKKPREIQASVSQYEKRKLKKGDLLLEKSGGGPNQPVGRVIHFDIDNNENNTFSNFTTRLRLNEKFEKLVNSDFIHKYLKLIYIDGGTEKFQNNSTNIRNLQLKEYLQLEIPLPPLPEQKRIVSILDKAFAEIAKAKANAEQNLKNAKELFESYLQGVFDNKGDDWKELTLKEISDDFGRGKSKHRPRNDEKLYGGNYPFIQTGDIRNCEHYVTNYSQTYNEVGLAQSKLWPKGTICITIAANIAETGVLSFDACFPDSVIGIVVNKNMADLDFIEYLLQSFKVNLQALGKGSAQDNLNMGTFNNKLFPFPSVKEQKKIVKSLNELSSETKNLKTIYLQKLNDLEELKKSVLQKAFNGELSEKELSL